MKEKLQRNDDDILDEIEEVFFQSPILNSLQLDVKVENGIVTLEGVIENKLMGFEAESVVSEVEGVREVINLLTVRPYFSSPQP